MSQENVELVMESIRRFTPGDLEAWAELWHPDTRLSAPEGWPEPGPFVGLDAVIEEFERTFGDIWSDFRFEDIEVVAESGDWVVATYRIPSRGATSGLEADFHFAAAYRIQGGLIAEMVVRWRAEDALEAAGLSE